MPAICKALLTMSFDTLLFWNKGSEKKNLAWNQMLPHSHFKLRFVQQRHWRSIDRLAWQGRAGPKQTPFWALNEGYSIVMKNLAKINIESTSMGGRKLHYTALSQSCVQFRNHAKPEIAALTKNRWNARSLSWMFVYLSISIWQDWYTLDSLDLTLHAIRKFNLNANRQEICG